MVEKKHMKWILFGKYVLLVFSLVGLALVLECGVLTNMHEFAHVDAAKRHNVSLEYNPLTNFLPCFATALTGKAGEAKFATEADIDLVKSNVTIAGDIASAGILRDLKSGLIFAFTILVGQLLILASILFNQCNLSYKKHKSLFWMICIATILSFIVLLTMWATINNMTKPGSDFSIIFAACHSFS